MNLHRVTYQINGPDISSPRITKRLFAPSSDAASKIVTELKKTLGKDLVTKPEREVVDVPTTKQELIEWLNKNAGVA